MLSVHGGIHFKNNEKTNLLPIQNIAPPEYIYLTIPENYILNIEKNSTVDLGQAVAFSKDEKSLPIYSSISGTITNIENNLITIKNDFQNRIHSGLTPIEIPLKELNEKDIEKLTTLMGIYDNGTPLSYKIKESAGKIENIIVSCTDSQPPSGISFPLLKKYTKELLGGIKILIHATKARRGIITISDTNEKFVEDLKEMITDSSLITVRVVENKYPIENNKYLIYALTRKEYTQSDLLKDSKILVLKPESVISIYRSFTTGIPTTEKFLSIAGTAVNSPQNVSIPYGTKICHVLNTLRILEDNDIQITKGGIMSGEVVNSDHIINQDFDNITIIKKQSSKVFSCIRCGKCIEVCPMLLKPLFLYSNTVSEKHEDNVRLGIKHCIECACCSYICPAKLPLSQTIKTCKSYLNNDKDR